MPETVLDKLDDLSELRTGPELFKELGMSFFGDLRVSLKRRLAKRTDGD